jgi:hypothetical protein
MVRLESNLVFELSLAEYCRFWYIIQRNNLLIDINQYDDCIADLSGLEEHRHTKHELFKFYLYGVINISCCVY